MKLKYIIQRITRGYCEADVWSLESYLTKVISNSLTDLANTHIGHPHRFKTNEEWTNYLKEMAEHFKNCDEDTENELTRDSNNKYNKLCQYRLKKGINPLPCYIDKDDSELTNLLDEWIDSEEAVLDFREQEKNKAFDMLKEVFFSLWD